MTYRSLSALDAGSLVDDLTLSFIDTYVNAYREFFDEIEMSHGESIPKFIFNSARDQIPWLNDRPLTVFCLPHALVFWDQSKMPSGHWYLDGGPAIKIDEAHTRTPLSVRTLYSTNSSRKKPRGIARAILSDEVPGTVWTGQFLSGVSAGEATTATGKLLQFFEYRRNVDSFLTDATFGFFGYIESPSTIPEKYVATAFEIVSNLGFFPADLKNTRFFYSLSIVTSPETFLGKPERREDLLRTAIYRDLSRTIARQEFDVEDYIRQFSSTIFWNPEPKNKQDRLYDAVFSNRAI